MSKGNRKKAASTKPEVKNLPAVIPQPPTMGPPTKYSIELAAEMCDRLGNDEALHEICKDERMPSSATVFRWLLEYADFRKAYDCALLARFDKVGRDCIKIADEVVNDFTTETGDDGIPVLRKNPLTLGRAQLMIDTRLRIAAKELPRKYGELQPAAMAPQLPGPEPVPHPDRPTSRQILRLADAVALYEDELAKDAG